MKNMFVWKNKNDFWSECERKRANQSLKMDFVKAYVCAHPRTQEQGEILRFFRNKDDNDTMLYWFFKNFVSEFRPFNFTRYYMVLTFATWFSSCISFGKISLIWHNRIEKWSNQNIIHYLCQMRHSQSGESYCLGSIVARPELKDHGKR
jgi:hypothetical protein